MSRKSLLSSLSRHSQLRGGDRSDVTLVSSHGTTWGPTSPRPASPVRNYHPQVYLSGIGGGGGARGESQAFPDPLTTQNGNVGQSRWALQKQPGARTDSCTPVWVSSPGEYGVAITRRRSARQFLAPNVQHVRGARERGQGLEISGYSEEDLRQHLEVLG